jgi:hypothetical protein
MELSIEMRLQSLQNIAPADIHIKREINRSEASSVYEIELDGATYAMKLVSMADPSSVNNNNNLVSR